MSRIAQQRLTPKIGTSSYRGDVTPQVPCEVDPELWFGDLVEQQAAKRICWAECLPEIRLACLKAAIDEKHRWGTWGGMTERDRNGGRPPRVPATANSMRKDPTPLAGCGTAGGYRNHYKLGQDACDDCLTARREHDAAARTGEKPRPTTATITDIEHLADQGIDLDRIAATIGVQADSVISRLRRNGRRDLIERLKPAA